MFSSCINYGSTDHCLAGWGLEISVFLFPIPLLFESSYERPKLFNLFYYATKSRKAKLSLSFICEHFTIYCGRFA